MALVVPQHWPQNMPTLLLSYAHLSLVLTGFSSYLDRSSKTYISVSFAISHSPQLALFCNHSLFLLSLYGAQWILAGTLAGPEGHCAAQTYLLWGVCNGVLSVVCVCLPKGCWALCCSYF